MTLPTRRLATFATATSLAASACAAGTSFRITTADLAHRDAELTSLGATEAIVVDADSKGERAIPIAAVVELKRGTASVANAGWFALRTRDGQRLVCKPTAIRNDSIVCATRSLGERTIPIADVASIGLATAPDDATPASQQDELRLANGDQLRGIVSGGDDKSVTCQTLDGQSVNVDWANVRLLRFAETQAATAAPASYLVALGDGTAVRATKLLVDAGTATLAIAGGDVRVPLADVASIEHVDGDAVMLAWIAPAAATYEPYFPSRAHAAASFTIDPAAADAFSATTAIRVRPRSSLRWTADAGVHRLRARCVVPAGKAFADVTIRVRDGDHVAFERKHVKSGVAPIEVDVPLAGGGSVALEADYGDDFDVQDQVVWLDPTLLRSPAIDAAK